MVYILAPLLFFFSLLHAPDKKVVDAIPAGWSKEVCEKANTAKNENYLSDEEKKVFYYTNLVRTDPKLFAKTYLRHFLDSTKNQWKKKKYINSLYSDLSKASPAPLLIPKRDLFESAKSHAIDMGAHGKIGHETSGGDPFQARIEELKKSYGYVYENCQYGYPDALSIVVDLLVDEDVEDLGHRKTILNKDLKYAGVSIQTHKKFRINCVIDYATEK